MQNKRLYIGFSLAIILIAVAAFVGGRMLNGKAGNVGLGGPNAGRVSISIDEITPAPELPGRKPDLTGTFVERKDNTIVIQAVSFGVGVGGVSNDSPMDENSGIRVEVVVTAATKVYVDITEFPAPVNGEIRNVQQAAAEGSLEDLEEQTFISVWGRRTGDRMIADTIFYSNLKSSKKP